jgi:hypothetical protein
MSIIKKYKKANIYGKMFTDGSKPIITLIIVIFIWFRYNDLKRFFLNFFNYKPDDTKSSLTITKAKSIADSLYAAMSDFGTDEESIFKLLQGLSEDDYKHVYNMFGLRSYNSVIGTRSGSLLGDDVNLNIWLSSELSTSDFNKLKNLFPNTL